MNLFKKAIVATAIVSACGSVHAADLTDGTTKYSTQGIEVATTAAADASLVVIVREQLEAQDVVTLDFGLGVKPSAAAATAAVGSEITDPADAGEIGVVYGSGTYKFEVVSFRAATATVGAQLVLVVKTGDPVTKDSSFEVSVDSTDLDLSKASLATVTYSAVDSNGVAKDTTGDNVGNLIKTQDQYGGAVKTKLDGVIERENQVTFISGGTGLSPDDADTLAITLTDNQTLANAANSTAVVATVTVTADNDWPATTSYTYTPASTTAGTSDTVGTPTVNSANKKELTFTVTNETTTAGIPGDIELTIDGNTKTLNASEYTVSVSVDADSGSTTNTPQAIISNAVAGEWEVDATIINIPYLPIGFEGTSSIVHFSNTSDSAVDVIVSAVSLESDDSNEKYDAVDLGFDLPANSVTKIKQSVFKNLFDLDDETKLSVTFNVNGDSDDVNAYATTKDDVGRTEISASDLD
jgi:hypothetical protein